MSRLKTNTNQQQHRLLSKHFKELGNNKTIVIIGGRETGKTTLIKNILYYQSPYIRTPFLISGTSNMKGDFDKHIPPLFIHDTYESSHMKGLYQMQKKIKHDPTISKQIERKKLKKHCVVVMDDVVSDDKIWKNCKFFKKLFFEGRHSDINIIISIHDPIKLPSTLRGQVQYLIITSLRQEPRLKHVFENYWPQQFGNFKKFKEICSIATRGWDALFIDLDKANKSNTFTNVVRYIRAAPEENLPNFRIGLRSYWSACRQYYDKRWKYINCVGEDNI